MLHIQFVQFAIYFIAGYDDNILAWLQRNQKIHVLINDGKLKLPLRLKVKTTYSSALSGYPVCSNSYEDII